MPVWVGSCNVRTCKMGMEGGTRHEREAAVTVLPHMMLEYISTRDHRVMRRLNSWRAPRWVRLWMICATRGGDGWLWYAMSFAIFLIRRTGALCCAADGRHRRVYRNLAVPGDETPRQEKASLRHCGALLGYTASTRPIFISFGPLDYRLCVRDFVQSLLPQSSSGIDVRRLQRCDFAHRSRHAFPQ